MSSMCENPNSIEALFETKTVNPAGVYMMYFYINGVKTPVMVDGYFPCHPSGKVAFCKSQ